MSKSEITWSKFRLPSGSWGPHAASAMSAIVRIIFFIVFVWFGLYLNLDVQSFISFLNISREYFFHVESD